MTRDVAATRLFKIHTGALWEASVEVLARAPIDEKDGFMHLSTGEQVKETARLHFAGQGDLWLIEVDTQRLEGLRLEPSRGGALFPHVYGVVSMEAVVDHWRLPWDERSGTFVWPEAARLA